MAVGWAKDDDTSNQIAGSIEDEISRARSRLPRGESLEFCRECGDPIPQARRKALPGVQLCIDCQEEADAEEAVTFSGYNRKGSKDSQLR